MSAHRSWLLSAVLGLFICAHAWAQVSTNARSGRFIRGNGNDEDVQSIVLALDFQKGIALDPIGGNGSNWFGGQPLTYTLFHYNATNPASAGGTNGRIAYQVPIVAFGSRLGGSPLYVGTQYRFGAASGLNYWGTNSQMFFMSVYDKRSNYTEIDTVSFWMPTTGNTNDWTEFATNGYAVSKTRWGMRTTIADHPGTRWALDNDDFTDSYVLTHEAVDSSATNYLFEFHALGVFYLSAEHSYYTMSLTGEGDAWWTKLYSIEFETRPSSRVLFIDQPHFRGDPLPPEYAGKSVEELTNFTATVTNQIWITNNANYFALDQSSELRQHPILDKFVADMRYDPLALTEFVLNEIELTDPMAFGNSNAVVAHSVNLGGVNRSALGTFLERQGSPWEQCALLVYLLRAAGQPAAYVFPTNNNLKMLDMRLSKLLRMQLKGALEEDGDIFTTNSLITVNYPWVLANINSNRVVHIFPWLKDTEVVEGLNLYDYMPTNYDSGYKWARQYLYGDTNILSLSTESAVPNVLFPRFIERTLLTNHPGISIDDLGVRTFNRPHSYARWEDLPRPTVLSNQTQVAVISNLVTVSNLLGWITTPFDTMRVRVWRGTTNLFDTGDMRTADLNARKFLLFTNDNKLTLWLTPYRTSITNESQFTNDSALLNKQVLQTNLFSNDDVFRLSLTHLRHRWLTNQISSFGLSEETTVSNSFTFSKADVAGICVDMGRVTTHMLDPHMEDYWREERKKQTNSAYVPPIENYQGTAAYLMGMGYHEKKSRFKELNQRLHKVRELTACGMGLGKLMAKALGTNATQPGLDMANSLLVLAASGTLRPDSGMDWVAGRESYRWLQAVSGSADEHAVINSVFGETNAISTVRLLQLAQARSNTNRAGIVELHNYDYVSRGGLVSTGYHASTVLSNYDSSIWTDVVNAFAAGSNSQYSTVFITPASITNDSGSYEGMGALIFEDSGDASLIGGNQRGGRGSYQAYWKAQAEYHQWVIQRRPSRDEQVYFYYRYVDPLLAYRFPSLPTAQVPTWFNGTWDVRPTPMQFDFSVWVRTMLNNLGLSYIDTYRADRDAGLFGGDTWLRDTLQWSSDPVNTLSGEFYIDSVDLTVPGVTPLQIRRNYLSQNRSPGHFGAGWKLNFTPHLIVTSNAQNVPLIYAAEPEGSVIAYRKTNDVWMPVVTDNPALNNNSAQGIGSLNNIFNARIVQTNATNYVLTGADATVRRYEVRSYPIATNSAGALYRTRPYLVSWKDPQGNAYTFSYGEDQSRADWGELVRIEASNGAFLAFEYDSYSRIVSAWTGDGRRVGYEYDGFGDLISVTLPDNSQVQYEYEHYPFAVTNGSSIATNIDSKHLLVKEIKPDGRVLQNEYDSQRRVTNQWATVGPDLRLVRNATFVYSNNFNFTNMPVAGLSGYTLVKDAYDVTTRYDYTNGLLLKITDPLNQIVEQQWYTNNAVAPGYPRSLHKVKDKRGLWTEYKYDSSGNITNAVVTGDLTGNGSTSETATNLFRYNTSNLLTNSVDAAGNKTEYLYDATFPYLRRQAIVSAGSTPIITNHFEYYSATNTVTNGAHLYTNIALGLLRREIRAYGSTDSATNEWLHDGRGFRTQQIQYTGTGDPAVTNFFVFNARGEQEEVIDGAGRKTRVDKDPMGRPILREVFEAGQSVPLSWEFSYYNENGELVWSDGPRFDPEDYVWRDYDGAGRKFVELRWRTQARADGSGVEAVPGYDGFATTFYEYDLVNRLTRTIDPRGVITTNLYDAIDRRVSTKVLDTDGSVLKSEGFAYEAGGEVAFHTNALAGITETLFTTAGKPHHRKNPDGSTNGWRYYRDGRQHKEFISNGNYVETLYDDANLRVTNIFKTAAGAALATNVAEMDRRGNVVRTMDAAHFWFTNSYDGLDRLKWTAGPVVVFTNPPNMNFPAPPPPVQQAGTNFYDTAGVVTTNANALGEKTVTKKDAVGRPVSIAIYTPNGALVKTNATIYSLNHHSQTMYAGSGASAIRTTAFTDNDNRPLLSLRYPNGGMMEFVWQAYDVSGNRTYLRECSSSNGVVTTWATNFWTHDNLNRVRTETVRDGVTTTLKYDPAGNLTNRVMPGNYEWRAAYDSAGRLLKDYDISGSTGANTNTYLYYAGSSPFAGLLQTKTDGRGVTCTYGYDQFLRLTTNAHDGPLAEHDLTTVTSYDARGSLIEIKEWFASASAGSSNYTARSYTPYQKLLSEISRIDGALHSHWVQSWDKAGRRKGLSYSGFGFDFAWRADGTLASVNVPRLNAGATYTYDTAGQLLTRSSGNSRTISFASRDGTGRPLSINAVVSGVTRLTETLSWRGDGRLLAHTVGRNGDFTNDQSFAYGDWTRRLTEERLKVSASQNWTNTFAYDGGQASKLGVLTKISGGTSSASPAWSGTADALHRIATETNNVLKHNAAGDVNGPATISAFLDGRPVPVTAQVTTNGASWQASLELTPGAHQLHANALHPFMLYTNSATSWFTNSASAQTVTVLYDASGQISQRIWKIGSATNRIQTLTWDGKGRLLKLAERTTNNTGFNWTAVYDALGRRLRTTSITVTNGITNSGFPTVISQLFDPETASLELGVTVNGETTWKLYGPDLNGSYGGLNGVGGLEAIAPPPDLYCPIIADARGNLHGVFDQRHLDLMWFPSRVTGYGAAPGYRPNALGHGAMVDSSSAWRGRWIDITGLIWLGERYYDPEAGRFLSPDPVGHGSDPALYTYAGGDPINFVDPLGLSPMPSLGPIDRFPDSDDTFGLMPRIVPQVPVVTPFWSRALSTASGWATGLLIGFAPMGGGSFDGSEFPHGSILGPGQWVDSGGWIRDIAGIVPDQLNPLSRFNFERPALTSPTPGANYGHLDHLGRPTGATAYITPSMIDTGSYADHSIRPPGFGGEPMGHARGHLFGRQLGGSGTDPRNLVTLFQSPVNNPIMLRFENEIRNVVESGQNVHFSATPVYNGPNPMPHAVTIIAEGSGGYTLGVSILNRR